MYEVNSEFNNLKSDPLNFMLLDTLNHNAIKNASELKSLLSENELNIVTAESLTAGQIIKTMADVPGNGGALYGGFVVYDTDAKRKFINVKTRGVYCEEAAAPSL